MLADVGEDEVGGDGGDLVEAGFAEFALYVVLFGKAEAAVGLQGDVGGFPGGIGRQQFGHVGFCAAGLAAVKETGGFKAHQVGGADVDVGLGDGELDALILADWPFKDHPLLRIATGTINEPVTIANTFGGNQNTLGVHAIQNVAKAHAFLTNEAVERDAQIVEEDLGSVVVDHYLDWLDGDAVAHRFSQIN